MADTEKSEQPQTNGLENGLDEDEKSKMRPADIDADVREMERRKRVEMIMSSKLFREELERIIELQLKDGNGPAGLLQQISDMMGIQSGKLHTAHMFRGSNCVTPINDIRGVESMGYEKGEKNLRCKLASVFRLMDLYGWSQGINNQITARLNQDEEHFLVNPHGMLFNEITASSLVKVDMQGNIVEPGTTNFSINTQGFLLHSAIHASRPDVNCVIHIKTPSVLAVSSLKCGLLPICQEALVIGEVSQHPFVSGIFEPEEREKIIRNLGPHNKVLLLHNHGAVCCGSTIEEAFYNVYNTVLACETQMKLMPIGVENLLLVSDETRKQVYDAAHRAPDVSNTGDKKKFRVGEMEFEALIRMLDNAGFRTGYIYRHPLVKGELPKPKNDVEVPPAVSSLGYLIEQEELYKQGNWKKYIDGRNRLDRTKWLNSPNVYQKVEILETGTSDPKKITKWVDQNSEEWVAESSPTHSSTPVKIESALQFVPKGTNPKEFKKLQQQIKENRRADKITSGPQSHILEGVSWEEAKKLQDANITQTGDQVILVGAASKGIIQRNYQHNALVYKTPYAKNPFDSMSDKEIEDYKQLVERKQKGDTDYEESQSESEAISSSRQDGLRHFKSPLLSPQSATSETEEESRDEPRVLRIETKTAPRPIQAEVVLSDAESDTTDARVERSHSARYPKADKPESVTLMNSFRKSWSLKREKDKTKDVDFCDSRNLQSSVNLKECEQDRMESLHCCVVRVNQLTHKPIIVNLGTTALRPLLKSASDPCNLSTLVNDEDAAEVDNRQIPNDSNTSFSCENILNMSELQKRLNVRKKLLHSAKMKFLGYHKMGSEHESESKDKTPTSPMCALISEIRETISEIMSPERSVTRVDSDDYFDSMRWIERPKFVSRSSEAELQSKFKDVKSKVSLMSRSFSSLNSSDAQLGFSSDTFSDFKNDFQVLKLDLENSERSDTSNCNCAIHGGDVGEKIQEGIPKSKFDENQNEERSTENVVTEVVRFVNASDEEATYTITDDSLLQTYSFTESTETEWYYNKTIMKFENSQTMLEIKETENKEDNLEHPPVKYIDTGIDTDFTSEKENESRNEDRLVEEQKEADQVEMTEDFDGVPPTGESSGLNKSSETDSSFVKTSSGRTSNDVDTSFAFKTETENSDKSPEKNATNLNRSAEEKKKLLEQMLLKTKELVEQESSDSGEANVHEIREESCLAKQTESRDGKLSDIPESPEFTNIDTEDAPVTSSSKDTSPEVVGVTGRPTEDEPTDTTKEQGMDFEGEKENLKPGPKRKKNVKSSTKITVKKELKENDSKEPVVSEIRLTIENSSANCQSEKYEVKIQDVANTSEDLSRSESSAESFVHNVDSYESFEIVDNSCDCEAQQSLEELQGEVSSTIEKLHTIEDYFEDEIKKHSSMGLEKKRNCFDECTIEYNYREFEEVLNESRGKTSCLGKDSCNKDVAKTNQKNNTEFFISSVFGDIRGQIQVCNENEEVEVFTNMRQDYENKDAAAESTGLSVEKEMEDIAMSSAFVAAILSEAVLEENKNGSQEFITEETSVSAAKPGEIVEVICNIQKLSELDAVEIGSKNVKEVQNDMLELFAEILDGLNVEDTTDMETVKKEKSRNENAKNKLKLLDENSVKFESNESSLLQHAEENHISDVTAEKSEQAVGELQNQDCQLPSVIITDEMRKEESKELNAGELKISCGQEGEGFVAVQSEGPSRGENGDCGDVQNSDREVGCADVILRVLEFNTETSGRGTSKSLGSQLEEVNDCAIVEETCSGENDLLGEGESQEQCYEQPLDGSACTEEHVYQQPAVNNEFDFRDTYFFNGALQTETKNEAKMEFKPRQKITEVALRENGQQCYREPSVENDNIKDHDCQQPAVEIESNSPEIYILDADLLVEKGKKAKEEISDEYDFGQQPGEKNGEEMDILKCEIHSSQIFRILFRTPLKAITYRPQIPQETHLESKSDSGTVEYILDYLVNSVMEKNRKLTSVNDIINFMVTNEESPTDSLVEFEDMENMISVSSSVVADIIDSIESQVDDDVVESLPDEELKDVGETKVEKRKRKVEDPMFKVTIATPMKKEIFINYSLDRSSTFDTSTDFEPAAVDLCNSYIKTDDVNEDFENLSSDNPDFYSMPSSGKNSLNSSFCSAEGHVTAEQFCCAGCEVVPMKSPRSLAIIQEVDEGDSSTSSEAAAPYNPN